MKFERPDGFVSDLPNCGITALAVVTGQDYETMRLWFEKAMGIKRPGAWKGWTKSSYYEKALRHFKVRFRWAVPAGASIALGAFSEMHTLKSATYLIRIPGHVLVLRDGLVLDNRGSEPVKPVEKYRRRKVTHAWIINP
ncbi:hypothetical protein ACFOOL_16400 [Devosia honganensis]|uniref:Peptidase C39-like domain-containing protein n=1 Tax=Devosia honganensis TaxID=1610527 RepID=A0ABV7X6U3_9HYPH